MATPTEEEIRYSIIVEAQQADQNISNLANKFLEFSRTSGASIKSISNAWKSVLEQMSGEKLDTELKALVAQALRLATTLDKVEQSKNKALEKMGERISQMQAVREVDQNDQAYAARIQKLEEERIAREKNTLAFAKQLEEVEKMKKADDELRAKQEALNESLRNGTATTAQYAKNLQNILSASTKANLAGISPTSPISPQMISQIKAGMLEIQSVTGLNVDRIKTILKSAFSNIPTDGINKAAKEIKNELGQVEQQAKKTGESGQSMWAKFQNTTLGILVARAILAALNLVKQFFRDSLKYAQDARSQMVQLDFTEAVLSKRGMDITREELDNFIADISAKYKYLSELEATKVVSETAGAVAEFDVSKKQLGELADAIAFIQTKNKLLGKEEADAAHIINAAMDARSNFFNGMGINITEAIVKEKAYKLGLVAVGEELSKQQRFQAILALLTEQTSGKQKELIEALEGTPLGNQMLLTKNYNDALGKIGEQFLSVKDNAIQFLSSFSPELSNSIIGFFTELTNEINLSINALQKAVDGAKALSDAYGLMDKNRDSNVAVNAQLTLSETLWKGIVDILKEIGDALNPLESLLGFLQAIGALLATVAAAWVTFWVEFSSGFDFVTSLKDAGKAGGEAFISGMSQALATGLKGEDGWLAEKLKSWWKEQTGVDLDALNIPTVPTAPKRNDTVTGETKETLLAEQSDLQKALEKMNEEILQSQIKLEQDMRDVAIDLGRAMVDITKEYAQKRADAERDYANKVEDINRNYAEKIASIEAAQWEAREQARVDEEQREREFQNRMQELKEKFLMDLDDALHERNARQILKLIKQYNLDKLQMERQHAIEEENARETERIRQESYERQKQAAAEARDQELADAQLDFERKMEELKIQEEREVEAAVLKANRKLQDLEKENLDRNTLIAAGLVNDFNLTQSMLAQIDQLFTDHYGYVTGVYQAMMAMLSQPITIGTVTTGGSTTGGTLPPAGGIGGVDNPGMGSNSTLLPKSGQKLNLSKFPSVINNGNRDMRNVFAGLSAGGEGGNSKVVIDLTLSPDLEARVVKNTMDKTAEVITRIRRSK